MGEVLGVGAQVTKSLRLVRRLGGGGMGAVWAAHHSGLDSHVVIKFISAEIAEEPGALERFKREAAAAARVRSPHVVQMLDYGITDGGTPYIVMELLEGQDIGGRLSVQPILPFREVVEIIRQVSRALGKAHELGIIHRDIKSENIFLCDTEDDELFVKLLDFGIAKGGRSAPSVTTTGAAVGTPHYMSPEQMIGSKSIDHRSDLWSLAVLVFFMLTGRRPFVGETTGALAIAIHGGAIPKPSEYNSALPKAFDAWFAKACSRDPDARFPTAKAFSAALSEALLGRTDSSPTLGEGGRGGEPSGDFVNAEDVRTVRGVPNASGPDTLENTVRSVRGPQVEAPPEKSTAALSSGITPAPPKRSLVPLGLAGLAVASAIAVFAWAQRDPAPPAPATTPVVTPRPVATPAIDPTISASTAAATVATASASATVSAPLPSTSSVTIPKSTAPTAKTLVKPAATASGPSSTVKPPAPKPPSDDLPDLK